MKAMKYETANTSAAPLTQPSYTVDGGHAGIVFGLYGRRMAVDIEPSKAAYVSV